MALAVVSAGNYANLTWQDHTVTTEVMLFPVRNQLLMKKHQTLNTKCRNEMKMFEKEKEAMIKRITIDKRMMERKKQALFRRRSEILLQRVSGNSSAVPPTPPGRMSPPTQRGVSAPARMVWAEKENEKPRPGVFLTETADFSNNVRELNTEPKGTTPSSELPGGESTSGSVSAHVTSASAFSPSSRRVISPFHGKQAGRRVKSVRFNGGMPIHETVESNNYLGSVIPLDERIKRFNENIKEFNERPSSETYGKYSDTSGSRVGTPSRDPLVTKKLSAVTLDTKKLENAFDDFCQDKSKEEYEKLVRMAARMRANVNLARNQNGAVPTKAGYKRTMAFKLLIDKNR